MSPIARKLLRWYAARRRSLPWRERPRPYAVWVAEIMAQQTRLDSMLPYYRRWMRRFPSIRSLAGSREQEVLGLWEGLGYYSRARNLRHAAQIVMRDHGGRLPPTAAHLQALPGIGRYTAGAIASLAFGADEPAVDGNAIRVLSRVFDIAAVANSTEAQDQFWTLARNHLPRGRAAEYNQALMDLGASLCAPRNPNCTACPLRNDCLARKHGTQALRPVKALTKQVPMRNYSSIAICREGKFLVRKRPSRGLLAGMWEFPNLAARSKPAMAAQVRKQLGLRITVRSRLGIFDHAYSHFSVQCIAYFAEVSGDGVPTPKPYRWVTARRLATLPMGKLDRRIANAVRDVVG